MSLESILESILERIAAALEKRNAMDVKTVVAEAGKLVDKLEDKDAKAAAKKAEKAAAKKAAESPKAEPAATTVTDAAAGSTTTPTSAAASAAASEPQIDSPPKKAKKLTVDDLRAVMQKYREAKYPGNKEGTTLCQDLLEKQFKSRTLGGLKEEDYAAVIEAFKV